MTRRNVFVYIKNRALRLFPGLCMLVLLCALVMGPWVSTLSIRDYFYNHETWDYLNTMLIVNIQYDLPGVFLNLPYRGAVNGSLWSLEVELHCYMILAAMGLLGLLRRWLVLSFALALMLGFFLVAQGIYPALQNVWGIQYLLLGRDGRWLSMFFCGAALYVWRDRIRFTPMFLFLAIAASLLVLLMPYGFYIHMLILPYIVIALACGLPRLPGFPKNIDLSYGVYLYTFPLQQLYMQTIGTAFGWLGFVLVITVASFACAWLSWHYVEKFWLAKKS